MYTSKYYSTHLLFIHPVYTYIKKSKLKMIERSPGGLVVSTSASHAKGPGFDPHRLHELSSKKSTNIEGDDTMIFSIIVVSGIVAN